MQLFKIIGIVLFCSVLSAHASGSVSLLSETGDTLIIHRLNNGELWASFMITDQLSDSFADSELIVLQVDQHQPIKLDQQNSCGGAMREQQKISYQFQSETGTGQWQYSRVVAAKPDVLKLFGWDKDTYQHLRSDRRPEVVDFPIQASIGIHTLLQQFQQGEELTFRYMTDAGETRQAKFDLGEAYEGINSLSESH